jgi:Copper transport outer membrane protein, MctB
MINFRFHLVSLIAVFLALGLGILVGSTVVDQVIVDRLDKEIKSVRHDSDAANAENSQLKEQVSKYEDFLKKSAAYTVEQRLQDVPVAVVVDKGVDPAAAKDTLQMLRDAGAEAPGLFWLNDSWRLDSPKDLTALEKATKVTGNNAAARTASLRLLARRLEQPTSSRSASPDVLQALRDGGFVEFTDGEKDVLETFPTRAARVLLLTGTDSHLAGSNTLVGLVDALADANVPTVVTEVYNDHHLAPPVPQRGASVAPVRGDAALAKQVATVDDGETVQGQISDVLALEQVAGGTIGHYGIGQGAQAPLPPLPS